MGTLRKQPEQLGKVLPGPGQNLQTAKDNYWNLIIGDIGHETGHSPVGQSETADHLEEGLMLEGNIDLIPYSPQTIKRFRLARSWSP